MAYYITTALGREVPLGDWVAQHGDTIVRVLYDFMLSPMNDGSLGLSFAVLSNATGLSLEDTQHIVTALLAQKVVRKARRGGYQLTALGVELVHRAAGTVQW